MRENGQRYGKALKVYYNVPLVLQDLRSLCAQFYMISTLVTCIHLCTGTPQGFQGTAVPLSALGRWKTVLKCKVFRGPNYENWNLAMRSA